MESAPLPLDGSCTDTQGLPTGNQYTYSSNATGSTFTLSFCLGQTTGGYPAGFNSITR